MFFLVFSFLSCIQQVRGTAHFAKCEQYELMADKCVLQELSDKRNLPYQAFALLCLLFPSLTKPFLRHPQDSSPTTPEVFEASAPCGASVPDFLLFPSFLVVLKIPFFSKHLLLQSHAASTRDLSGSHATIFSPSNTSSIPINPHPFFSR